MSFRIRSNSTSDASAAKTALLTASKTASLTSAQAAAVEKMKEENRNNESIAKKKSASTIAALLAAPRRSQLAQNSDDEGKDVQFKTLTKADIEKRLKEEEESEKSHGKLDEINDPLASGGVREQEEGMLPQRRKKSDKKLERDDERKGRGGDSKLDITTLWITAVLFALVWGSIYTFPVFLSGNSLEFSSKIQ
jgi:hypothetical protein